MKIFSCLGIFLFFIAGCNQPAIDYDKIRNDSNMVIKSFSSLPIINIQNNKAIVLKLDRENKDVIVLDGVRRFAAKISMPMINNRFALKIEASSQSGFFLQRYYS